MNLNQVTVSSTDLKKSIDFYERLGLIKIVEDLPNYARFQCPDGTATFSLHCAEHLTQGKQTTVIYFECDNLDDTVKRLKEAGIKFSSDPIDQSWLWREATLQDPDGNVICLYYAGENRLNPPWRIF